MKKLLFAAACTLGMHVTANGYECAYENIESTSPIEKFLDNGDGTVTDLRFGLMWSVCTYGQTYNVNENKCQGDGEALLTWSEALHSQEQLNEDELLGYDDWRLPNIKELHSIVERACRNPAIRSEVFPDSLNVVYWSNTPDNEVNPSLIGRVVDFADGSEFFKATSNKIYVRHVRSINNQ
jgi:hypothetical protein